MRSSIKNPTIAGRLLKAVYFSLFLLAPVSADPSVLEESLSLQDLIDLPESDLATIDIATLNLAAAEGLPGSETVDSAAIRAELDAWARRIAAVTEKKAHLFKNRPDYYENSWAKYCTIILVLELQQSFGVHYNFEQRTEPSLAKSKDQFIHGIVEGTGGTCASLPVVTVAVGRRLGYPMKLAQGFSHFYARWDDPETGEQFNIESSNRRGLDFFDDDHYRAKAREYGFNSIEKGNYLRSMTPREELSSFLSTRGDCLRENGRIIQAFETYREAVKLAPENHFAESLLHATAEMIHRINAARRAEAFFQQHDRRRRTDPRLMIPGMPSIPTVHSFHRGRPGRLKVFNQWAE